MIYPNRQHSTDLLTNRVVRSHVGQICVIPAPTNAHANTDFLTPRPTTTPHNVQQCTVSSFSISLVCTSLIAHILSHIRSRPYSLPSPVSHTRRKCSASLYQKCQSLVKDKIYFFLDFYSRIINPEFPDYIDNSRPKLGKNSISTVRAYAGITTRIIFIYF